MTIKRHFALELKTINQQNVVMIFTATLTEITKAGFHYEFDH